jgi:hypothetical protein
MISATATTTNYILQPGLVNKHRETVEWLSATVLWKRELRFFQRILDQHASKFIDIEDKKKIDHFQNLIIYYSGELIPSLSTKLRLHEKKLAEMLELKDELNTGYFKEHTDLMHELESFDKHAKDFKESLFNFIEKVM